MKINATFLDRTNLVGEWLLDGNANDTAGNNDGTATNVTWVASDRGYVSDNGKFNGTNAFITTTHQQYCNNTFSLCYWLRVDGYTDAYGGFAGFFNNGHYRGNLLDTGNSTPGTVRRIANGLTSNITPTIDISKWFFVIQENTATESKLYFNNKLEKTHTGTYSTNALNTLTLGKTYPALNQDFGNCGLGSVRIFNKKLSENEKDILYLEGLRKLGPIDKLPSYNISLSPVSYYPLNGDVNDYIGSNNGTWSGTESYNTVWGGEAAHFNGSSTYINLGDNTAFEVSGGSTTLSMFAWFRSDDIASGFEPVFAKYIHYGVSYSDYFFTVNSSGELYATGNGTNVLTSSGANIQNGEICHIGFTLNGSTMTMYKNLKVVGSGSLNLNSSGGNQPLLLGGLSPSASSTWATIDLSCAYIDNTIISSSDLEKLYNSTAIWVIGHKYSLPNLENGKVLEISKAVATGIYYDQSGNGNNGTATAVTDTAKGLSNLMTFNGTTSKIDCGSSTSLDNVFAGGGTFSCWFNAHSLGEGSNGSFWDKSDLCYMASNSGRNVINFQKYFSSVNGSWQFPTGTKSLSLNTTYHLAITYDEDSSANNPIFYLNGAAQSNTETLTPSGTPTSNASNNMIIGNRSASDRTFDGEIISPKFHNRILSADEIRMEYNSCFIQ